MRYLYLSCLVCTCPHIENAPEKKLVNLEEKILVISALSSKVATRISMCIFCSQRYEELKESVASSYNNTKLEPLEKN